MKKRKITRTALTVTLVLALMLPLAACGKTAGDSSEDDTVYSIGFNTWGAGVPIFDAMGDEIAYSLSVYGAETSRVSDDFTAERELENIQNFISAGIDGIAMQIATDPVLSQAASACKDAKIPFTLSIFVGDDDDRAQMAAGNEYFAGAVSCDLYGDGYLMGETALVDGHKTAVLVGGNIGDKNIDLKAAGFTASFEAGGGKVLDAARCTSAVECQEKASAVLSSNRDVDCLYAMVGDYLSGSIVALDNLGLDDVAVYVSNADKATADYIKEGRVASGTGGSDLASGISAALLINYLDGNMIRDENDNAPDLKTSAFIITSENADDYIALFYTDGTHPISESTLKSLVSRFNPDANYETFVTLVNEGLTLEALLAAQ